MVEHPVHAEMRRHLARHGPTKIKRDDRPRKKKKKKVVKKKPKKKK